MQRGIQSKELIIRGNKGEELEEYELGQGMELDTRDDNPGFGHTLLRQRELASWGYVINSCDELTGEWEGENPNWGRRMREMEQR